MKKILLFFVMVLLVLVSARSLFSYHGDDAYSRGELDKIVFRDIDESSLHAIVRLLDLELKLVDNLLRSKTGYDIDKLLIRRKKLLKIATGAANYVYGSVMNFATSDVLFSKKKHVKSGKPLQGSDKRRYLKRVKKILAKYRSEFHNKQYYVSQRTLGLSA